MTVVNDREYLVIERDNNQADLSKFKKVYKIDISKQDANGFVAKEEVADLLNIPDPLDLNKDGSTTYRMPFVTIENILAIDANTILVGNDNNYPFSVGRPPAIDNNEIVQIGLDKPLNLSPLVGIAALGDNKAVAGTAQGDTTLVPTIKDTIFADGGNDLIDSLVSKGGDGKDRLFTGIKNFLSGGDSDDTLFAGKGSNTFYGGAGADKFYLTAGSLPTNANSVGDFEVGIDKLFSLGISSVSDFSKVTFTQQGADTLVKADGKDLALLTGIQSNTLNFR